MTEGERRTERRARRMWVSLVVLLLGMQIAVGGLAIHLATGDPTVAVIPDYHHAALHWDQVHRADGALERLGWSVHLLPAGDTGQGGRRVLQIQVLDADRRPVETLSIGGTLYHHARANEILPLRMEATGQGYYRVVAPMPRAGLWQLRLDIAGGAEPMRYAATLEI